MNEDSFKVLGNFLKWRSCVTYRINQWQQKDVFACFLLLNRFM